LFLSSPLSLFIADHTVRTSDFVTELALNSGIFDNGGHVNNTLSLKLRLLLDVDLLEELLQSVLPMPLACVAVCHHSAGGRDNIFLFSISSLGFSYFALL
jgi:hypothetical protein